MRKIKGLEWIVLGALVAAAAFFLFGCVSVPLAPHPDGTPSGETALVPGWSSDTPAIIGSFLPSPWGDVATALLGAAAVPLLGAAGSPRVRQALAKGKIPTALGWKHSTPLVET